MLSWVSVGKLARKASCHCQVPGNFAGVGGKTSGYKLSAAAAGAGNLHVGGKTFGYKLSAAAAGDGNLHVGGKTFGY